MAIISGDYERGKRGTFAKVLTFQTYHGRTYARAYVRPVYKNTPNQQFVRAWFANAVWSWQHLDIITQYLWRALAYGTHMSGYEYYIKKFIKDRV